MLESFLIAALNMHFAEWAMTGAFVLLFLIRVVYLVFFTGRVAFQKKQAGGEQKPVSLLMTLRNEEDCLRKNMPRLLSMNNVDFEVVAVDDFSHDNSLTVLGAFCANSPRLKVSSLNQETRYSEKLAQNVALKAAQNEWVMVVPPSINQFNEHWLAAVSKNLDEGKDLVVSYSNVQSGKDFIRLLFRVEYFFQQVKSFGFILNGLPYVITEDNAAFRKKKYFEVGGFRGKIAEPFANLELV
ncbi:MAG TPA: glycosyltransferase, partial [Mariniphaga anaerophila]|nr:glycosyltransferase [Mariniphaga anaerophila]